MDAHEQNGNSCVNGSVNGSINGHRINGHNEEISIGSAGSLARRQSMWDDDLLSGKFILYSQFFFILSIHSIFVLNFYFKIYIKTN